MLKSEENVKLGAALVASKLLSLELREAMLPSRSAVSFAELKKWVLYRTKYSMACLLYASGES